MCYIDIISGEVFCYNNTFSGIAKAMLSSPVGIAIIVLPILIFSAGFYFLKKYEAPSRNAVIIYIILALVIYAIMMTIFGMEFFTME